MQYNALKGNNLEQHWGHLGATKIKSNYWAYV